MRPSPLVLALALLSTACGGNSSSTQGKCPATPCGAGLTCQPDGTCVTAVVNPDGGIAACTSQSEKPVGDSALAGNSPPSAYVLVNREPHKVGDLMTFTVPPGTASITIVEQAIQAPDTATFISGGSGVILDNVAVPHTVDGPSGSFHFDDVKDGQVYRSDYSTLPAYFFSDSPATGTLTIPNTSNGLSLARAGGLPAGIWSALISDYAFECASNSAEMGKGITYDSCVQGSATSTYDVTVIAKPVDASTGGLPGSGTLNVMLNFVATSVGAPGVPGVPPQPLNATEAVNDLDLQRLVLTLQSFYAKQNITVNVKYQNAPADVQTRYASGVNIDQTGACSDLSQLLRYGAPGNVLNIFLVSQLVETTNTGSTSTVGIDGTIPGPASIGGTVASGAVVSAADLRSNRSLCVGGFNLLCGADETAYIVAHEAGHFLGLYHLTEKYGLEFDPLAETPTCTCKACAPPGSTCATAGSSPPSDAYPMDQLSQCLKLNTATNDCGGGDNLMFWLLATGSAGNLSGEQGQVMRANPLVLQQ